MRGEKPKLVRTVPKEDREQAIKDAGMLEQMILQPGWKEVLEPWIQEALGRLIRKLVKEDDEQIRGAIKAYNDLNSHIEGIFNKRDRALKEESKESGKEG